MRPFALVLFSILLLVAIPTHIRKVFALTTAYKSASTVTTSGSPAFTNLSNCSSTDGLTCNRALGNSFANLYFNDFGDYGLPPDAIVTGVKIRVTGRTDTGLYAGVSQGTIFTSNCQFPSDLWTMWALSGPVITTYNSTGAISSQNLWCLTRQNIQNNNLTWRINYSSGTNWSANIDNFEVAYEYTLPNDPTPTPTPTVPPIPTPKPFLDLPWDYEGKGLTFSEAALSMSSYFDHEYPLLSSGKNEPTQVNDTVREYNNVSSKQDSYSSHDGYDYAKRAKVYIGDSVLAAADGEASYINSCISCGNMIIINHGNGYQTRYLHMQKEGLITATPGIAVHVVAGQKIGKVGATGNVSPVGDAGAHIHFGVIEDKNHDGKFDDNIPDGITDPFGWQSKEDDPWEKFSFFYNGIQRSGNKSYYLWKKKLDSIDTTLTASGGTYTIGGNTLTFPSGVVDKTVNLSIKSEPIVVSSATLYSIGPSFSIDALDTLGNPVTQLIKPFNILIDFNKWDSTRFDTNSISLYSSQDGTNWIKETTTVDLNNKKASAYINHLTHFALMADRLDITPPVTTLALYGEKGKGDWYRSAVEATLTSEDNENGSGVDYILYKFDNDDWQQYIHPISISGEGKHTLQFYAVDNDENIETVKTANLSIDTTKPNIIGNTTIDGVLYNKLFTNKDVLVTFECDDALSGVDTFTSPILVTTEGVNQNIDGTCADNAGNISFVTVENINIDKTPPIVTISTLPSTLWPPNGKMVDVFVRGGVNDISPIVKTFEIEDEYNLIEPILTDFNRNIKLEARRNGRDKDGRVYIIKVLANDAAGNSSTAEARVIVPHEYKKENEED